MCTRSRHVSANSPLNAVNKPLPFRTEHVVYAILAFSMATIVVLAYLTANGPHPLPTEVTTGFVGTVVGGTLTTIAQKLGKIGSR
jgi:hypothetical protein